MASRRHLEQYPLCGQRAEHAYPDGWRGACHDQGKTTPAACTDHIRAPKGDPVQFWDPRNWQSLCSDCNRVKAIRYESGFGRTPQP
jgi:5-methylcytosine-specific restriction endonuclease McrA